VRSGSNPIEFEVKSIDDASLVATAKTSFYAQ
jgi:hypothetical protein